MKKKDEFKLTNWQVPKNPRQLKYDRLKKAPPIDMKKYENIVHEMTREESVKKAEKVVPKFPNPKANLNTKGVNDNRSERKFWTPPAYRKKK